eukprot:s4910_g1.t1
MTYVTHIDPLPGHSRYLVGGRCFPLFLADLGRVGVLRQRRRYTAGSLDSDFGDLRDASLSIQSSGTSDATFCGGYARWWKSILEAILVVIRWTVGGHVKEHGIRSARHLGHDGDGFVSKFGTPYEVYSILWRPMVDLLLVSPGCVSPLFGDDTLELMADQNQLQEMDNEIYEPLNQFDADLRDLMMDCITEKVRRILSLDPSKYKNGRLPFGLKPDKGVSLSEALLQEELERLREIIERLKEENEQLTRQLEAARAAAERWKAKYMELKDKESAQPKAMYPLSSEFVSKQVETKVEVERPPTPPVETPKVKREDPPPVIQGLSDEEVKRLLEEQEKAYKAKIQALEKRIKALEEEVKKLKEENEKLKQKEAEAKNLAEQERQKRLSERQLMEEQRILLQRPRTIRQFWSQVLQKALAVSVSHLPWLGLRFAPPVLPGSSLEVSVSATCLYCLGGSVSGRLWKDMDRLYELFPLELSAYEAGAETKLAEGCCSALQRPPFMDLFAVAAPRLNLVALLGCFRPAGHGPKRDFGWPVSAWRA